MWIARRGTWTSQVHQRPAVTSASMKVTCSVLTRIIRKASAVRRALSGMRVSGYKEDFARLMWRQKQLVYSTGPAHQKVFAKIGYKSPHLKSKLSLCSRDMLTKCSAIISSNFPSMQVREMWWQFSSSKHQTQEWPSLSAQVSTKQSTVQSLTTLKGRRLPSLIL